MHLAGARVDVAPHRQGPPIDTLSLAHGDAMAFAQSLITMRSNVLARPRAAAGALRCTPGHPGAVSSVV
jgi:hypothetical protein